MIDNGVTKDLKQWAIYNARLNQVIFLTNEEFKKVYNDLPLKLKGEYMQVSNYDSIWIDGILESDYLN
jgi:hypothetical protein